MGAVRKKKKLSKAGKKKKKLIKGAKAVKAKKEVDHSSDKQNPVKKNDVVKDYSKHISHTRPSGKFTYSEFQEASETFKKREKSIFDKEKEIGEKEIELSNKIKEQDAAFKSKENEFLMGHKSMSADLAALNKKNMEALEEQKKQYKADNVESLKAQQSELGAKGDAIKKRERELLEQERKLEADFKVKTAQGEMTLKKALADADAARKVVIDQQEKLDKEIDDFEGRKRTAAATVPMNNNPTGFDDGGNDTTSLANSMREDTDLARVLRGETVPVSDPVPNPAASIPAPADSPAAAAPSVPTSAPAAFDFDFDTGAGMEIAEDNPFAAGSKWADENKLPILGNPKKPTLGKNRTAAKQRVTSKKRRQTITGVRQFRGTPGVPEEVIPEEVIPEEVKKEVPVDLTSGERDFEEIPGEVDPDL